MASFEITDNSGKFLQELEQKKEKILEEWGLLAEGYAKANLTSFPRVDTGALRNSVSHTAQGDDEYIGSNISYAPYVEYGTGPYAEGDRPGRTDVPWLYKSEKDGKWHLSYGMKASHFLKNAIADHVDDYKQILEQELKS